MPDGARGSAPLLDLSPRMLAPREGFTYTPDQAKALDEMLRAAEPGDQHRLEGPAGTGKTSLLVDYVRERLRDGKSVAVTAPTHKAVAVLRRKLVEAGVEGGQDDDSEPSLKVRTIQSLLSLRPKVEGDRQVFVRDKRAKPVEADDVIVDECSMCPRDLMALIRRHLKMQFVLFSGDRAQLPPVGEVESEAFGLRSCSRLETIVRQAEGNPILEAAHAIRRSQGTGEIDWSWVREARNGNVGVFTPRRDRADDWMRKAFTSEEYDADADRFRYLAWTNARVAQINEKVRRWRYGGPTPTPYMPGEMAMFRQPLVRSEEIVCANNDEYRVLKIEPAVHRFQVPKAPMLDVWTAEVPSWRMEMANAEGNEVEVHATRDDRAYQRVIDRIKDEAAESRSRWEHLHAFTGGIAQLQHVYAQTIHTSQGSTFETVFLDIENIGRRAKDNILEAQQLYYVGATRPSLRLILVNI